MARTIRGMLVKREGILIDVRQDGSVHFDIQGPAVHFDATEEQAVIFRDLLTAVLSWDDGNED
jgi:hypothetical protein